MILTVADSAAFAPLAAPIDGEAYMELLVARQAAWEAGHFCDDRLRPQSWVRPLLEWFIQDGDEKWVTVPESKPAPKRVTTPRVYRSAASIREELATVDAQMDRIAGSGSEDNAVVNLSPYSRSRAARSAGRRRFAQLDRDLEQYGELRKRRDALASRLISAEAREKRANI